jgi:hypothetical protein
MAQSDSHEAGPQRQGVYSGGSGTSMQDAVVITVPQAYLGIRAEYAYIEEQCGRRDVDWRPGGQALLLGEGGKRYDCITIRLQDGAVRDFYFDITSFYAGY